MDTTRYRVNTPTLREKCPYSELFWSVFFCIIGEILRNSPYSVQMRENVDQKNSKHKQILRSAQHKSSKTYQVKTWRLLRTWISIASNYQIFTVRIWEALGLLALKES